jgi:hypothetical protein
VRLAESFARILSRSAIDELSQPLKILGKDKDLASSRAILETSLSPPARRLARNLISLYDVDGEEGWSVCSGIPEGSDGFGSSRDRHGRRGKR